jgi:hypothetical protein
MRALQIVINKDGVDMSSDITVGVWMRLKDVSGDPVLGIRCCKCARLLCCSLGASVRCRCDPAMRLLAPDDTEGLPVVCG